MKINRKAEKGKYLHEPERVFRHGNGFISLDIVLFFIIIKSFWIASQ